MAETIKGINVVLGADTTSLTAALADVQKAGRNIQSELRQVERLLKMDPKNTELLAQKQKLLTEAVANTKEKLDSLKAAQQQVNDQFAKGEISEGQYRAFQREIVKTEEELKRFEDRLKETGQSLEKLGDRFDKAGKKLTDVGKDLSKKVTAPIVGVGVAALKTASDFEDAMAKVSTLADTTQVSMKDLRAGILDISSATGVAATEISGSVYDALSAGVDTADVLEYVKTNVMLTKAGFTEMGTAVDATSTVLNAYGDAAFEVSKIGDILVKTQDEGKISVDELGKNLGRVIPTASSLGVNIDQLGAAYAIMTAKGQNANIATTNLNSLLVELGKTGSKSDKALREMTGKSFREMVSEGKSVGDVLALLEEHADKSGLALSDMFGSVTAGSAALTLLSDGADAFNGKVDVMNDATGAMATNVEKLLTPSEKMSIAFNQIKNEGIEMGTMLLPALEKLADGIGKVAGWLGSMDEGTRKVVLMIGGLVAAIGPALIILGKLSTGVSQGIAVFTKISGAITKAGGVIGLLSNPITLTIAAIAAMIAVGVLLWKNWDTIKEKLATIWESIKTTAGRVWDGIATAIKAPINAIISAINVLIRGLNKIHFDIPKWVPLLGGKSWGFNMPEIPKLAKGGIVTRPTVAMIGEAGPEAVLPLSRNSGASNAIGDAVGQAVYDAVRDAMSTTGSQSSVKTEIVVKVSDTAMARVLLPALTKELNRRGSQAITVSQVGVIA